MRNLIAIATVVMISLATPSRAATLEEILAKNLTARGGEAKLREVKTLRMTGHLVFGGGDFSVEAAWGQVQKRGPAGADQVRSEFTLQGLTAINAYDGREGWNIMPFQGRLDAEKASDDDARGWRSRPSSVARWSAGATRGTASSTSAPRTPTARRRSSCA